MKIDFFKDLLFFAILLLIQVLVLNHIHLFGYATPLVYVYFVLRSPRNRQKWALLLWSFSLGLIVDCFTNTPGVATASMTFIGMLQPYILTIFLNRESPEDLVPTSRTLGWARYIYYSLILIFIYTTVFFALEAFNFFNWQTWVLCAVGSFLLTAVLIFVIENLRTNN